MAFGFTDWPMMRNIADTAQLLSATGALRQTALMARSSKNSTGLQRRRLELPCLQLSMLSMHAVSSYNVTDHQSKVGEACMQFLWTVHDCMTHGQG